jgi:hypothetical protein
MRLSTGAVLLLVLLNVALQAVESKTALQSVHQLKKKRTAAARQSALVAGQSAAHTELSAREEEMLRACDAVGVVAKDTIVYHGSPAANFKWMGKNPWPAVPHDKAPDPPAWFAFSWQFSIHAGLRYLVGQQTTLNLHRYKINQQGGIAIMDCKNHAELFVDSGIGAVASDNAFAAAFCKKYHEQYNGYRIQHDAVRKEPELILCNTKVLTPVDNTEWSVAPVAVPNPLTGVPDQYTGAIHGANKCILKNNNLGDFKCA